MIKSKDTVFENKFSLNCHGRIIDLSTPKIMGIINLTPDSFYDGGKIKSDKSLLYQVEKHLSESADILDIGAFSSRPGSEPVNQEEELKRLGNSTELILKEFNQSIISVDTYRSTVAAKVLDQGASIINDITGGSDHSIFKICSEYNAPIVLMHNHINAFNHESLLEPKNVLKNTLKFLQEKIELATSAGMKDVIIDPGFGFGKTMEANYALLNKMKALKALRCPILVGVSRKRMVYETLNTDANNALNGTSAIHMLSLINGGNILRVHDTREAKEVVDLYLAYNKQA